MIDRPGTDAGPSAGGRTSPPRGPGDSRVPAGAVTTHDTPAGRPFNAADLAARGSRLRKISASPAAGPGVPEGPRHGAAAFGVTLKPLAEEDPRMKRPRPESENTADWLVNGLEKVYDATHDSSGEAARSSSDESSSSVW